MWPKRKECNFDTIFDPFILFLYFHFIFSQETSSFSNTPYNLIWCNTEQVMSRYADQKKKKKEFNELILKVLNLLSSVSDFNFSPKFRESNNLLTTGLYDRLSESNHTLNQIFHFHCYCTVFARVSFCSFDFFPLITHIVQIGFITCKIWALYGHLQSAWGFLLRYWCHRAFQSSLKYKETGGIPPQLLHDTMIITLIRIFIYIPLGLGKYLLGFKCLVLFRHR